MLAKKLSGKARIRTGVCRGSYLHLFEPWAGDSSQDPKYSACILIPEKDKETIKLIKEAIAEATDLGQQTKWNGKVPKNLHDPLRDGDEREGDEYEGHFFLNANSKKKPQVVDKDLNPVDPDDVKSGDYLSFSLTFYPYATSGNNGVAVGLDNAMLIKEGPALGGSKPKAESDFDDVEIEVTDDDEDMLD